MLKTVGIIHISNLVEEKTKHFYAIFVIYER